jgi:hypothetical protein
MPAAGVGVPIVVKIEGGSPYGTLYQIPIEVGHDIETLTAPAYSSYRNALLITYCDYDVMGGDIAANQNCQFTGCSSELLRLWRKNPVPYGPDWWGSTLRTTNMWDIADITALMTAGW